MKIDEIQQIYVVLEYDANNDAALDRALMLAEGLSTEHKSPQITLLCPVYLSLLEHNLLFDEAQREAAREQWLTTREQWLDHLIGGLKASHSNITGHLIYTANAHDALLSEFDTTSQALVLKTPGKHHSFRDLFLPQKDWDLIRHCPLPTWLPVNSTPFKQVIACIDPLHASDPDHTRDRAIIETAQRVAHLTQAKLIILHTYLPLPNYLMFDAGITHPGQQLETIRQQHQQAAQSLLKEMGISDTSLRLLEGHAEQILRNEGQKNPETLIILGATARGAIDSSVMGNTAERVLQSSECEVLICPANQSTDC
ncbi:universal stress protein [Aestuariirhabdus sp. Z084]|uniref:universal stress protein n=1 Tax=Aestuariirhabdus haliotis TaxID=2918751 RepID=UPI00201B444A|nr:universal stress protein [Aestuariirhabdus haliotis]MCL6417552.1 universal stress protein [Aestuariirhabdus haliotis]MCL6421493.1 universal stress protein [Aestuariirhabdus haliotis]